MFLFTSVKTIMNIIQVFWRTAPTVAVPARVREPENNVPTDLQEGHKIDKYMYVYMTLTKYTSRQASWVQEVHTSIPALYGPNYCPHYLG